MNTISREAYIFLIDAFEKSVKEFFDDPVGYADGTSLIIIFNSLKNLGIEFDIDIISLAMDGDIERLKEEIKLENIDIVSHEKLTTYKSHYTFKNVEEKLNKLPSYNEMIGEWTIYKMED